MKRRRKHNRRIAASRLLQLSWVIFCNSIPPIVISHLFLAFTAFEVERARYHPHCKRPRFFCRCRYNFGGSTARSPTHASRHEHLHTP